MNKINSCFHFFYDLLVDILNGLNLLKTLYINFKFLSFKDAFKLPIYIYGRVKFQSVQGIIVIEGKISNKMVILGRDYSYFEAPQGVGFIQLDGTLVFQGKAVIGHKYTLSVQNNATLYIGEYVRISNSCKIKCYNEIKILKYSSITPECQIFDTNFHYLRNIESGEVLPLSLPIQIGECCWIGNRTTLMKGTVLPNNTIVSSNSLVTKNFSDLREHSIIGGMPAKLLKNNMVRVYDWELYNKLNKHFKQSTKSFIAYKGEIDETKFIEQSYF